MDKKSDKRTRILDALASLMRDGKGGTASVSEIARAAGIAKGGIYYYFRSKDEVLDALIDRHYDGLLQKIYTTRKSHDNALKQMESWFLTMQSTAMDPALHDFLHLPQNAALHQKSLSRILVSFSPMVAEILQKGQEEGIFHCKNPQALSNIVLSVLVFLFDPGLFSWTEAQKVDQLQELAALLEKGLESSQGSFAFLYA
jgi:AcrR family transcriptional regulator